MKKKLFAAILAFGGLLSVNPVSAQEVTLRLQHFLPAPAAVPAQFVVPWVKKIEDRSGGRIKIDIYPAMQLGGKPPSLYDQIKDGVIDIGWTLPGYTPGRFPSVEAFELPFMMTNAPATSKALNDYIKLHGADEFKDVKIIALHVHGPGVIHARGEGVKTLEDMKGKKVRGPTRITNSLIKKTGATPIGMPVPAVPGALSKGVIDATVLPWEVTKPLKVSELTNTHTEFSGDRALYTASFVFAMNKAKYDSLPEDLRQIIDENSGAETGAWAARVMAKEDILGRKIAVERGNPVITIDGEELTKWQETGKQVEKDWIAEMNSQGKDGQKMVDDARALIEKHTGETKLPVAD